MIAVIHRNKKRSNSKGFTLVETLVAISILLSAVVAPLVFLANTSAAIFASKDKITALYLAEDAIDFVKYRIYTNFNAGEYWLYDKPNENSMQYTCNPACTVDSFNDQMGTCPSEGCPPIQKNPVSGAYGYESGWSDTKFTRTITLSTDSGVVGEPPDTSANHEQAKIKVSVSWMDKGVPRQVLVKGYAFNWGAPLDATLYNLAP